MRVPHLTCQKRSQFYSAVQDALSCGDFKTDSELPVSCLFTQRGGYRGKIRVRIDDALDFESDWKSSDLKDWSRFPARIRAAATALKDSGHRGVFQITHDDGMLTVTRADALPLR